MEVFAPMNYVARSIKTEQQYNEAIALIETLIDAEPGTPEMDLLELVSILVHDYEQREFPIETLDPIEAIKYQMEELGVTTVEMAELIGGKSRLSELLHKKRPLSIRQIKAISARLDIPADILLAIA
ncbi:helix-turn-helix domain-containing protein [Spirosoma foliorum]|uniref:Transcriptional regulator n=1 Tax=Spirosoma foliorum TaxID=2710596 RepID=A0A7G5H593_9BACT|nr:transcriptional regulator [Spirosoma foliorum]QMW06285.1 transcriptional regulator [Spirosoma foliorum]